MVSRDTRSDNKVFGQKAFYLLAIAVDICRGLLGSRLKTHSDTLRLLDEGEAHDVGIKKMDSKRQKVRLSLTKIKQDSKTKPFNPSGPKMTALARLPDVEMSQRARR